MFSGISIGLRVCNLETNSQSLSSIFHHDANCDLVCTWLYISCFHSLPKTFKEFAIQPHGHHTLIRMSQPLIQQSPSAIVFLILEWIIMQTNFVLVAIHCKWEIFKLCTLYIVSRRSGDPLDNFAPPKIRNVPSQGMQPAWAISCGRGVPDSEHIMTPFVCILIDTVCITIYNNG